MSDDLLDSRPSFKQSTDLVLIRRQQRYQPIRVQVPEQRELLSYFLEQRLIQSRARERITEDFQNWAIIFLFSLLGNMITASGPRRSNRKPFGCSRYIK